MINLRVILIYFKKITVYSELQSQLIATLTSVIPIILIFSYLDYYKNGSIGKRVSGLTLIFKDRKLILSIYRNIIKFLPWQLGHIGVIHGMYTDFKLFSIVIRSEEHN